MQNQRQIDKTLVPKHVTETFTKTGGRHKFVEEALQLAIAKALKTTPNTNDGNGVWQWWWQWTWQWQWQWQ